MAFPTFELFATNQVIRPWVNAIQRNADEARLEVSADGIQVRVIDAANTTVVDTTLPAEVLDGWTVTEGTVGINLNDLHAATKEVNKRQNITLSGSAETRELEVINPEEGETVATLSYLDPDGLRDPADVPEFDRAYGVEVDGGQYSRIVRALDEVATHTAVGVVETDDGFVFRMEGKGATESVVGAPEHQYLDGEEPSEEVTSTYTLEKLANIRLALDRPKSTDLRIRPGGADLPIEFEYGIGPNRQTTVTWVVAPRVGDQTADPVSLTGTVSDPDVVADADGGRAKELFAAFSTFAAEGRVGATDEGLELRVVDEANVAQSSVLATPDYFDFYEVSDPDDAAVMGIGFNGVNSILRKFRKRDDFTLSFDADVRKLSIEHPIFTYQTSTIDPDSIRKSPTVPELDNTGTATVPFDALDTAVAEADSIAEFVIFFVSDGDAAAGSAGDDQVVVRDLEPVAARGQSASLISAEKVQAALDGLPVSGDTEVKFVNGVERPIAFQTSARGGSLRVNSLIAPRVRSGSTRGRGEPDPVLPSEFAEALDAEGYSVDWVEGKMGDEVDPPVIDESIMGPVPDKPLQERKRLERLSTFPVTTTIKTSVTRGSGRFGPSDPLSDREATAQFRIEDSDDIAVPEETINAVREEASERLPMNVVKGGEEIGEVTFTDEDSFTLSLDGVSLSTERLIRTPDGTSFRRQSDTPTAVVYESAPSETPARGKLVAEMVQLPETDTYTIKLRLTARRDADQETDGVTVREGLDNNAEAYRELQALLEEQSAEELVERVGGQVTLSDMELERKINNKTDNFRRLNFRPKPTGFNDSTDFYFQLQRRTVFLPDAEVEVSVVGENAETFPGGYPVRYEVVLRPKVSYLVDSPVTLAAGRVSESVPREELPSVVQDILEGIEEELPGVLKPRGRGDGKTPAQELPSIREGNVAAFTEAFLPRPRSALREELADRDFPVELTDISGVGPARGETLEELGLEDTLDLAAINGTVLATSVLTDDLRELPGDIPTTLRELGKEIWAEVVWPKRALPEEFSLSINAPTVDAATGDVEPAAEGEAETDDTEEPESTVEEMQQVAGITDDDGDGGDLPEREVEVSVTPRTRGFTGDDARFRVSFDPRIDPDPNNVTNEIRRQLFDRIGGLDSLGQLANETVATAVVAGGELTEETVGADVTIEELESPERLVDLTFTDAVRSTFPEEEAEDGDDEPASTVEQMQEAAGVTDDDGDRVPNGPYPPSEIRENARALGLPVEFTDIEGIGPSRAEPLRETGYDDLVEVALDTLGGEFPAPISQARKELPADANQRFGAAVKRINRAAIIRADEEGDIPLVRDGPPGSFAFEIDDDVDLRSREIERELSKRGVADADDTVIEEGIGPRRVIVRGAVASGDAEPGEGNTRTFPVETTEGLTSEVAFETVVEGQVAAGVKKGLDNLVDTEFGEALEDPQSLPLGIEVGSATIRNPNDVAQQRVVEIDVDVPVDAVEEEEEPEPETPEWLETLREVNPNVPWASNADVIVRARPDNDPRERFEAEEVANEIRDADSVGDDEPRSIPDDVLEEIERQTRSDLEPWHYRDGDVVAITNVSFPRRADPQFKNRYRAAIEVVTDRITDPDGNLVVGEPGESMPLPAPVFAQVPDGALVEISTAGYVDRDLSGLRGSFPEAEITASDRDGYLTDGRVPERRVRATGRSPYEVRPVESDGGPRSNRDPVRVPVGTLYVPESGDLDDDDVYGFGAPESDDPVGADDGMNPLPVVERSDTPATHTPDYTLIGSDDLDALVGERVVYGEPRSVKFGKAVRRTDEGAGVVIAPQQSGRTLDDPMFDTRWFVPTSSRQSETLLFEVPVDVADRGEPATDVREAETTETAEPEEETSEPESTVEKMQEAAGLPDDGDGPEPPDDPFPVTAEVSLLAGSASVSGRDAEVFPSETSDFQLALKGPGLAAVSMDAKQEAMDVVDIAVDESLASAGDDVATVTFVTADDYDIEDVREYVERRTMEEFDEQADFTPSFSTAPPFPEGELAERWRVIGNGEVRVYTTEVRAQTATGRTVRLPVSPVDAQDELRANDNIELIERNDDVAARIPVDTPTVTETGEEPSGSETPVSDEPPLGELVDDFTTDFKDQPGTDGGPQVAIETVGFDGLQRLVEAAEAGQLTDQQEQALTRALTTSSVRPSRIEQAISQTPALGDLFDALGVEPGGEDDTPDLSGMFDDGADTEPEPDAEPEPDVEPEPDAGAGRPITDQQVSELAAIRNRGKELLETAQRSPAADDADVRILRTLVGSLTGTLDTFREQSPEERSAETFERARSNADELRENIERIEEKLGEDEEEPETETQPVGPGEGAPPEVDEEPSPAPAEDEPSPEGIAEAGKEFVERGTQGVRVTADTPGQLVISLSRRQQSQVSFTGEIEAGTGSLDNPAEAVREALENYDAVVDTSTVDVDRINEAREDLPFPVPTLSESEEPAPSPTEETAEPDTDREPAGTRGVDLDGNLRPAYQQVNEVAELPPAENEREAIELLNLADELRADRASPEAITRKITPYFRTRYPELVEDVRVRFERGQSQIVALQVDIEVPRAQRSRIAGYSLLAAAVDETLPVVLPYGPPDNPGEGTRVDLFNQVDEMFRRLDKEVSVLPDLKRNLDNLANLTELEVEENLVDWTDVFLTQPQVGAFRDFFGDILVNGDVITEREYWFDRLGEKASEVGDPVFVAQVLTQYASAEGPVKNELQQVIEGLIGGVRPGVGRNGKLREAYLDAAREAGGRDEITLEVWDPSEYMAEQAEEMAQQESALDILRDDDSDSGSQSQEPEPEPAPEDEFERDPTPEVERERDPTPEVERERDPTPEVERERDPTPPEEEGPDVDIEVEIEPETDTEEQTTEGETLDPDATESTLDVMNVDTLSVDQARVDEVQVGEAEVDRVSGDMVDQMQEQISRRMEEVESDESAGGSTRRTAGTRGGQDSGTDESDSDDQTALDILGVDPDEERPSALDILDDDT